MPRALSTALRARIKADIAAGHDIKTIMATHTISDKKARAMKKLYDNCGEVWLPAKKGARTGRPPKITPAHEERLRLYLADRPDAYIKDMCRFLEGACGTLVDESTMWRTVRRLGWQASRVVKPRDERGFWVQTLPRDETGHVVTNAQKRAPTKKQQRPRGGQQPTSQTPGRAMTKQLLARTRAWVREHMAPGAAGGFDVSHDYGHVERVLALSMEILRVEQKKFKHIKFDETVTELVALMHDIDDHKYRDQQQGQQQQQQQQQQQLPPFPLPTQQTPYASLPSPPSNTTDPPYPPNTTTPIDPSLPLPLPHPHPQPPTTTTPPTPPTPTIETHLITLGWPPHIAIPVAIICAAVPYTCETAHPDIHLSALRRFPELAIVQDADRLDALGAVGVGRAFAFGGARARGLGETVRHFGDKLGRLEGLMKTGEGRRMARVRGERVEVFKGWVLEEMGEAGMGVLGMGVLGGEGGGGGPGEVEVGGSGMGGGDIAPVDSRAGEEDPGSRLVEMIDDVDGTSDDESSSDSA